MHRCALCVLCCDLSDLTERDVDTAYQLLTVLCPDFPRSFCDAVAAVHGLPAAPIMHTILVTFLFCGESALACVCVCQRACACQRACVCLSACGSSSGVEYRSL